MERRPRNAEMVYPVTYRQPEIAQIMRATRRGQSVLVCGSSGTGKSHLLRFLAFHPALAAPLPAGRLVRLHLDCNAAAAEDAARVFRALLLETDHTSRPQSAADTLALLRTVLAEQVGAEDRVLIVIDRFERIPADVQPDVLDGLRHIRDYLGRKVSYVLGSRVPPPIADLSEEFDDLLADPPVVWVGALSEDDARWNLAAALSEDGIVASERDAAALMHLTGRHPRLLRTAAQVWANTPDILPDVSLLLGARQVQRVCESIWRELDEAAQLLFQRIMQGEAVSLPADHILHTYGFVLPAGEGWQSAIPLLAAFVQQQPTDTLPDLTALEQRLWRLLQEQPQTLIRRDDLIDLIYGDDPDGINDEALTALVSRLRRKIERANLGSIEALRGQGYRYTPLTTGYAGTERR